MVSDEVRRSLELVPLSPSAAGIGRGTIVHDAYWRLSPAERLRRQRDLRALPSGIAPTGTLVTARQYEAQQPPLYYLLLTPVLLASKPFSLPAQVLALRIVSVALASSVVFLAYAAARSALCSRRIAMLVAVLISCLPGLFIDIARVGNESFAIVCVSGVMLFALRACRRRAGVWEWLALGGCMGAALLTKTYAVALLPLLALPALLRGWRHPKKWKQTAIYCAAAFAIAIEIGGWWYWRNWTTTGTLSGEQLDAAAARFTFVQKLAEIVHVDWRTVIDIAAFSHIWMGGWSFLVLRSWMYRACEGIAVLAAAGVLLLLFRRRSMLRPAVLLASSYFLMCLALGYFALVAFLSGGFNLANGWYLYPVVTAEAVLIAFGLRGIFGKRWALAALAFVCCLAAALDLYSVNALLMPHSTGLVRLGNPGLILERLSIDKPALIGPTAIGMLWAAYLSATLALVAFAWLEAFYSGPKARRTFPKGPPPTP
jgi:hypothetical protein